MNKNNLFHDTYSISDYDSMIIDDTEIDTEEFTKHMDEFEMIDRDHPFITYLIGFTHNQISVLPNFIHGWFHKKTQTAKFYVFMSKTIGNYLYFAWQKYCKMIRERNNIINRNDFNEIQITIYVKDSGRLCESNHYETEEKIFYGEFMKSLIDYTIQL